MMDNVSSVGGRSITDLGFDGDVYTVSFIKRDKRGEPASWKDTVRLESAERVVDIYEADLNTMEPTDADSTNGAKYIAIGKPKSGKSKLIKAILKAKSSFIPVAVAFAGTDETNHDYSSIDGIDIYL